MKKKLEAELISIAHRILKLKHKEDVVQLHQETQKLYEKLSILRFYEENFEALKPTLTHEELDEKIEAVYGEREEVITPDSEVSQEKIMHDLDEEVLPKNEEGHTMEEIPVEDEKILIGLVDVDESEIDEEEEEPVVVAEEPQIEEEAEEPIFEPVHSGVSQEEEEILEEKAIDEESQPMEEKHIVPKQISFADLLGDSYSVPDFVKVDDVPAEVEKATESTFENVAEPVDEVAEEEIKAEPETEKAPEPAKTEAKSEAKDSRPMSLNDKFSKTITLSLNDRITFEKQLFGGSGEDLNRVLSQLNTFNSLEEAKNFIDDLVKPDYDEWKGKDEFSSRFMELVEKKFA